MPLFLVFDFSTVWLCCFVRFYQHSKFLTMNEQYIQPSATGCYRHFSVQMFLLFPWADEAWLLLLCQMWTNTATLCFVSMPWLLLFSLHSAQYTVHVIMQKRWRKFAIFLNKCLLNCASYSLHCLDQIQIAMKCQNRT